MSRIRCPVISGTVAGNRWLTGLGTRIGHRWVMVSSFLPPSGCSTVTSTSVMVYSPSGTTDTTVPSTSGGTIHLCKIACVSCTSAITVPPWTVSPSETVICVSHNLCTSRESTLTPLVINALPLSAIRSKGLSIPSNMLFRIPGARVTDTAAPVDSTYSPGRSPDVSSYTCTVVMSLSREITSPTSFSSPTYTISDILNSVLPFR